MLQNLLYVVIISTICLIWGLSIFIQFQLKNKKALELDHLFLSFFCGLATLSVIAAWMSLMGPVRFWILPVLTIPLAIYCWRNRSLILNIDSSILKQLTKIDFLLLGAGLLLFLTLSAGKIALEDADIYHIQSIKWIHEYGTVKGIANLFMRFGFYSNWFHAISLFQMPFSNQNFIYLNLTFTIWLFGFLYLKFRSYVSSERVIHRHLALFYFSSIVFFLFEWDLFRVAVSSTTYDFIITGTVFLVLHYLIQKLLLSDQDKALDLAALILLLTAPFYKTTGLLMIGFWLLLLVYTDQKKTFLLRSVGLGLLCATPFLFKNYIQTGYPIFPYTFIQLSDTDWQVPSPLMKGFNDYIYWGNHYINQAIPNFPHTDPTAFSYVDDWFLHLVQTDQIILALCVVGLPVSYYSLFRLYQSALKKVLLIWLCCFAAIILWIFYAPDLRFAFGYIIFLSLFPLTALFYKYFNSLIYNLITLGLIACMLTYGITKGHKTLSRQNILWPVSVEDTPFSTVKIQTINFHIPDSISQYSNTRCFGSPLPCIYTLNPNIKPLGRTIKDGFKMDPLLDSAFIENYRY